MRTIDSKKVIITFGEQNIAGYADGEYISIEFPESFTLVTGADGESGRIKSNNASAKVTLTLLQVSKSNDYLSAKHTADLVSNAGVAPFTMVDLSGTSLVAAPEAWISTKPKVSYSKGMETRQWVIEMSGAAVNIGGN
jgi:hypothetical protein